MEQCVNIELGSKTVNLNDFISIFSNYHVFHTQQPTYICTAISLF